MTVVILGLQLAGGIAGFVFRNQVLFTCVYVCVCVCVCVCVLCVCVCVCVCVCDSVSLHHCPPPPSPNSVQVASIIENRISNITTTYNATSTAPDAKAIVLAWNLIQQQVGVTMDEGSVGDWVRVVWVTKREITTGDHG